MSLRKNPDPAPAALPPSVVMLARQLSRIPGVGEKSGIRLAILLATGNWEIPEGIAAAINKLHGALGRCKLCGSLAEQGPEGFLCTICGDHKRDPHLLCIVGRLPDLLGIERSGAMRGRYFVLGQLLSPLDGVDSDALPIEELRARIQVDDVREVIIATPTSTDGQATALFLARELRPFGLRITRLASGIPHGGDLEAADVVTVGQAIQGRTTVSDG